MLCDMICLVVLLFVLIIILQNSKMSVCLFSMTRLR